MLGKILLLLVIVGVVGLTVLGCARTGGVPRGWSGAVVADGALFLGSTGGKLVALDVSTRSRLWPDVSLETLKPAAGGFGCAPASTTVAIYGTPAMGEDLVYVGGYNGRIYALNSSSGIIEWKYPPEGRKPLESIVGGPVVSLGKVYFGCSEGKVHALDAATGDWVWDFPTGDKIWSTPTVVDGDTLYIGSFDKKLYALDVNDGKEKWKKPFETQGAIASAPVVYDNMVYIGSFDRHIYAVDATSGKQIWQFPVEDGAKNEPENWFWAKPVIRNNTIYAGNLNGKVYILNAETGDEVADAIDLGSPICSWPVLVNGSIIIASEEGKVYALDTNSNEERLLVDLKEKIYASLCDSEGVIYIHTAPPAGGFGCAAPSTEDTLYALNAETGVMLWSLPLSTE